MTRATARLIMIICGGLLMTAACGGGDDDDDDDSTDRGAEGGELTAEEFAAEDAALLDIEVKLMNRLLAEGRLGPEAEVHAHMQDVAERENPKNFRTGNTVPIPPFFTSDFRIIPAAEMSGSQGSAFRGWLLSEPVQAAVGEDIRLARKGYFDAQKDE